MKNMKNLKIFNNRDDMINKNDITQIKIKNLNNVNKMMQNTFMLLSATIMFSAITSLLSVMYQNNHAIICLLTAFITLFLINIIKYNLIRLALVFVFTGLLGCSLGPVIHLFMHTNNGNNILVLSLTITGISFFLLSMYAIITKRNLQFLDNFLFIGSIIIISCIIINILFNITMLHLMLAGFIMIFSAGTILYTVNGIIRENETDYISATITLYLQIYNIFLSLLTIFARKD